LGENPDLGTLSGVKNAVWQNPTNNIPQLTRKGYQPSGFCWEHIFGVPELVGIACCMSHLAQSALGTEYAMLLLLFDTPFPGLKKHYNWKLQY
jgi:hypothetical protein